MKYIEKITVMENFDLFGTPHLVALFLMCMICAFIIFFRNKISQNVKFEKCVANFILTALIFNQVAYYSWFIFIGEFSFAECLPFNLCTLSVYISIYFMLTKEKRIFGILYFLGIGGATQALLTPSMNGYNFPHFRFYEFFLAHSLIVITVCYGLAVLKYTINLKEVIKAFCFLQLAAVVAAMINVITGGNYMFLAQKPDSASIMSLLAPWPYYIFQLEIIVLVIFALLAVPFIVMKKKNFFVLKENQNILK